MGLNLPELNMSMGVDLSAVYIPKTISDFLREVSMIRYSSEKLLKFDDFVKHLEDELRKIDAFKRELPLCMLLLNDAILRLKEEAIQYTELGDRPAIEEFIPLKGNSDEDGGVKAGDDYSDKKNWMSSAQLWSTNSNSVLELKQRSEDDDNSVAENPFQSCKNRNRGGAFVLFKGNSAFSGTLPKEDKEILPNHGLTLMPPMAEPSFGNTNSSRAGTGSSLLPNQVKLQNKPQQQASRKQRRCWSPELHRRFVSALQQLGGSQVATPKQIRELMQVDGLTNDEVKSHLQKYRLHVRRLPAASAAATNGLCMGQDQCGDLSKANNSQSGSPQGPLHVAGSAKGISTTGGDSMEEEEEEKSEGHSWRGRIHKLGEDDV